MTSSTIDLEGLRERVKLDEQEQQPVDKADLNNRLQSNITGNVAGIGLEVGTGYATDLVTTSMLAGGPLGWLGYAGINFASGAASNWAAQKLRGEEEISWGEIISSGLIDIIPFFGQKVKGAKGVANVALQSGARTVAQRQGEEALDEGRWLTPRETLEAAALGGAFGTAFKGAGEGINLLRGRYGKYGKNEARNLFPTEVVEELNNQNRLFDDDAIDDMNRLRSGLNMRLRQSIDPENSYNQTEGFPLGNYRGKDYYESSLDPNYKPSRGEADRKVQQAVAGGDPATFNVARTDKKLVGGKVYMKTFFENWTPFTHPTVKTKKSGEKVIAEEGFRVHHENPLRPSYEMKRGLTAEAQADVEADFAEEGIAFGDLLENYMVIPHEVHRYKVKDFKPSKQDLPLFRVGNKTVHKIVNQRLGTDDLSQLIKRFKKEGKLPNKPWHKMQVWEREPVYEEVKLALKEGREFLTSFYQVVAALNPNNDASFRTMMNAVDKLDDAALESLAYSMVGRQEMPNWAAEWIQTVLGSGELVPITRKGETRYTWTTETARQLNVWEYLVEKYGNSDIGEDMQNLYNYALKEEKGMEMLVDRVFNNFTWNQINKKYKYWDPDMKQLQLAVESVTPKLKSVIRDVRQMTVEEIEARINAGWNVKGLN